MVNIYILYIKMINIYIYSFILFQNSNLLFDDILFEPGPDSGGVCTSKVYVF
jgi:hypothetical protein